MAESAPNVTSPCWVVNNNEGYSAHALYFVEDDGSMKPAEFEVLLQLLSVGRSANEQLTLEGHGLIEWYTDYLATLKDLFQWSSGDARRLLDVESGMLGYAGVDDNRIEEMRALAVKLPEAVRAKLPKLIRE